MKNKIAFKLITYFSLTLLLFSLVIGGLFMVFFKSHTVNMYKADMEKRAGSIAENLSDYLTASSPSSGGMGSGMGGHGAYLRFLDEIAMSDVWIVDEDMNLITTGLTGNREYQYAELPENADELVREAFQGTTAYSEGFSPLLDVPTLTIGMPIYSKDTVIGVLLLHSPIEGMNEAIYKGFSILGISLLIALFLSFIVSILLAITFTRPLKKMKDTAMQLAGGDYSVKTDVKLKDEIGELASAIDILSEKLHLASTESERLEDMRKEFIANISHELRTPVTVIRGSLEALCDGVVTNPDQVESYHQQMLNESIFLQRLVNDLLDLSKLQNTDFRMEMDELSLCDILHDTVRSSQQIASKKNISVLFNKESEDCRVVGDYDRLRQMFLIMLDNAIKFSPPDAVVTVTLSGKTVSVSDEGPGISQEDLPYIFDRFYKSKAVENSAGTGLGLSIARQIAERHQVAMQVDSSPERGTRFTFTFK